MEVGQGGDGVHHSLFGVSNDRYEHCQTHHQTACAPD